MSRSAAKIQLTPKQQTVLEQFAKSRKSEIRLAQRAKVILLAFAGVLNAQIAQKVQMHRNQVGIWRSRFAQSAEALRHVEEHQSTAALRATLRDVFRDAPRCGRPPTFTAEQVTGIIAVACEDPQLSGRPVGQWTLREIQDEVTKRGIVRTISHTQVWRLLEAAQLKPHRSRYWLFTKEKDPALFEQQVQDVCQAYLEASELYAQMGTHTVCVDEMPQLQALERSQTRGAVPGHAGQVEYEYTRHGTLTVMGTWHVVLGQVLPCSFGLSRTNVDFCEHIKQTVALSPEQKWVFVLDNLNIHQSEELVRFVAEQEGIAPESLGKAKSKGFLFSMKTRREFLSDKGHRIRFVYTPVHSSWLNQIEVVFGIVRRRLLRGSSFKSGGELQDRLQQFFDYFNSTFAKPFRWTYTGRPTDTQESEKPRTWRQKWVPRRKKAPPPLCTGN